MKTELPMDVCQRRLAVLWFGVGLPLFAVLIVQSLTDHYGEGLESAWSWFLPTVAPTLMLILGTVVGEIRTGREPRVVSRFVFLLALVLSAVYLLSVAAVVFSGPVSRRPILEVMEASNLFLGPLQGFTALALGVFFVRAVPEKRKSSDG